MKQFFVALSTITSLLAAPAFAQVNNSENPSGRIPGGSTLAFLNFAPDARHAALGEAGVASTPDAAATYWNASKLAFAEEDFGATLSYTPWLGNITDDMFLGYVNAYKKIDKRQAIAGSFQYFNNGEIDLRDGMGGPLGNFTSREFALAGTYSRQLSSKFAMGLTLKWIYSNLSGNNVAGGASGSLKPASTAAGDISLYYNDGFKDFTSGKEFSYGLGLTMSNFGGKISYSDISYFIPTNLRLGGRITYSGDGKNKFNLLLDVNKLMAPTPPHMESYVDASGNTQWRVLEGRDTRNLGLMSGVFGSFTDAPNGFKEELQEVSISTGLEYLYNNTFAVRVGYQGQSAEKLGNSNFTAGLGVKFQDRYNVDFAYLVPMRTGSPLANTFRITVGIALNKATDVIED